MAATSVTCPSEPLSDHTYEGTSVSNTLASPAAAATSNGASSSATSAWTASASTAMASSFCREKASTSSSVSRLSPTLKMPVAMRSL